MAFVTWQDVVSDGSQTDYTIIFPYLSQDHVKVSFNGVDLDVSSYSFFNSTTIRLNSPATLGTTVRVYRDTPQTVITDFHGGYLPESDLDNGYLQQLYSIQELQDKWNDAVADTLTAFNITNILQDADADTWINAEQTPDIDILKASKTFWIETGDSGYAGAPSLNADELVIEGSGNAGISILTPAANSGYLTFGDPADNDVGYIQYSHPFGAMVFYAEGQKAFHLQSNGIIVNGDQLTDMDFVVYGDINTNFFIADTSTERVGISSGGLAPTDGVLHIQSGSAGAVAASAVADELVIEGAGDVGITLLSPSANNCNIALGDPGSNTQFLFDYDHNVDIFQMTLATWPVLTASTTENVINDAGGNFDFRVEGDTRTHVLFVDGANQSVHLDNSLLTGAGQGDMVMTNSSWLRFVNNAGTSSANFGVYGDTSDNLNFEVPAAGDSHNLRWVGNIRAWFQEQNSGMGLVFNGESSADHAAPSANNAVVYTKDNGSGKTQLCVRFNTGAVQVLATQP